MNKNAGSFLTARGAQFESGADAAEQYDCITENYLLLQHYGDGSSLSFLTKPCQCSIDIIKVISNVTNC